MHEERNGLENRLLMFRCEPKGQHEEKHKSGDLWRKKIRDEEEEGSDGSRVRHAYPDAHSSQYDPRIRQETFQRLGKEIHKEKLN